MKTLFNLNILKAGLIFCALLVASCGETKKENAEVVEVEPPVLESASQEYADIVLKMYDHFSNFDYDALGAIMADDITWYWPDGGADTRNSIKGKDKVIEFWKNWEKTTGGKMTFAKNTLLPIKANKPTNYYKAVGSGVLAYTDMTITLKEQSTTVRQHAVIMFNDDMKISNVFLYYDRTGIMELTNVVFGETE
ncbi:nuclear transport factor 2 family protein [Maribacter halichondriae]|uniref:nuclear transport factor 2 family protein n=1 Tax=Maribacter halichondriae TaxID=2980554 RepID=UPI002359A01F|nr:nuclear transport factor 2 family protein [Maribacter sp. Hal144]